MVHLKCKKPQYSKKEKERKKNQMPKSIVFLVGDGDERIVVQG
jgi:hypothetical protein